MKALTLRLEDELYERVREQAFRRRRSITSLVREGLKIVLAPGLKPVTVSHATPTPRNQGIKVDDAPVVRRADQPAWLQSVGSFDPDEDEPTTSQVEAVRQGIGQKTRHMKTKAVDKLVPR